MHTNSKYSREAGNISENLSGIFPLKIPGNFKTLLGTDKFVHCANNIVRNTNKVRNENNIVRRMNKFFRKELRVQVSLCHAVFLSCELLAFRLLVGRECLARRLVATCVLCKAVLCTSCVQIVRNCVQFGK